MTEEEARKKIEDANGDWEIFTRWISGQTCGLYENGMIDYYEYDVDRFIKYRCSPKNEPIEEWD